MSESEYRPIDDGEDMKYDPFGYDVKQAQLIVSMKIYDVLMALLTLQDKEVAKDLDELHSAGVVIGQGPTFLKFFARDSDEFDRSDIEEEPKSTDSVD